MNKRIVSMIVAALMAVLMIVPAAVAEEAAVDPIQEIIAQVEAASIKDMGKVMGAANKALAGLSDGRTISTIVKEELSK